MKSLREDPRETPVVDDVDVLVVGGGPAGIHAAIAASAHGARTTLVERYGFLGGMATAALVGPILGVFHWGSGRRIIGGYPWQMLEKMESLNGALLHEEGRHVPFDPEIMKFVADGMSLEKGVSLRLHTLAVDTIVDDKRIEAVIIEDKTGRSAITAQIVVDATGDGDIAARSGAAFEMGRPGDHAIQPNTSVFRIGNVDLSKLENIYNTSTGYVATNVRDLMLEQVNKGHLPPFGGPWIMKGSTVRENEAFVNAVRLWGNSLDAETLSKNEVIGRAQIQQMLKLFQENVDGLQGCHLIDSGTQIGIRETRRFLCEYILDEKDILKGRSFDDSIAVGGHIIDIHAPDGSSEQRQQSVDPYGIPYRALLPKGLNNILVAGRPIGVSHVAHASVRVMGTCMAIGQGAGVAAAMASKGNRMTRDVDIRGLRESLIRLDAVIS